MGTCAAENIERMLLAAKPVLTDENLTSSEVESVMIATTEDHVVGDEVLIG